MNNCKHPLKTHIIHINNKVQYSPRGKGVTAYAVTEEERHAAIIGIFDLLRLPLSGEGVEGRSLIASFVISFGHMF